MIQAVFHAADRVRILTHFTDTEMSTRSTTTNNKKKKRKNKSASQQQAPQGVGAAAASSSSSSHQPSEEKKKEIAAPAPTGLPTTKKELHAMKKQMKKELKITDSPFFATVKGYHEALKVTAGISFNALTNESIGMGKLLHECTWKECKNTEQPGGRNFSFCSMCYTKYCSAECQLLDHKQGDHKQQCLEFRAEAARFEKCERCKNSFWRDDFLMCEDCFFAE